MTSQAPANSRISALVYSRLTVACVPSTATRLLRDCAQAGLIAGTVPTNGTEKRTRNSASARVDAVLQAIDNQSGACFSIAAPITSTMRAISASSG